MKTNKSFQKIILGFVIVAFGTTIFWACQNSILLINDVKVLDNAKLSRLAKTYVSEVTDAEYQIFQSEYKSLDENELRRFNEIVIENESKNTNDVNALKVQNEKVLDESQNIFNESFNKLNNEEKNRVFESIEKKEKAKAKISLFCPTIAYGRLRGSIISTSNLSCSSAYLINVQGQSDCDYECEFVGLNPQSYSVFPIMGSTPRMKDVLNSFNVGSIMARQLGKNGYILLGAWRTLYYLKSTNPVLAIKNELKIKK